MVLAADGSVVASRTGTGRGAWLCRGSGDCAAMAARSGAVARALNTSVVVDADRLRQLVHGPATEVSTGGTR